MSGKVLWLNRKKLQELPLGTLSCEDDSTIEEIHACFNYICRFSFTSCLIKGLTVLSLSCNNLTDIPNLNGMATSCSIRELYLANNKITIINHLEGYPHLRVLDLRHNAIKIIENIGNKAELVRLSLSCNEISAVNFNNLIVLPKLTYLGLFSNLLDTSFPLTQLLCYTPSVTHLFVGCNPLSKGNVLAVNSLLLELCPQELINIAAGGDSQQGCIADRRCALLQRTEAWPVLKAIILNCPTVEKIDGDSIVWLKKLV